MSSEIDFVIQLGYDITSNKYYGIATATVLFYDHLLTLGDEIKYAWSGKRSWIFWLFVFNRYFPMSYQFWHLAVSYGLHFNTEVCNKTAFYTMFMAVVCNLLAHVVLTVRVYAVTMKNIPITIGFAIIGSSQLALGICMVVFAVRQGSGYSPLVPLDSYRICALVQHNDLIISSIGIALLYDILMFSLIIFLAMRSTVSGLKGPRILGIIAGDAMRYFLVIFATHFTFEVTMVLGREAIQLLPGYGIFVFLPVMVSRIVLSLRKAVDMQQDAWSFVEPPRNRGTLQSMKFARPRGISSAGDGDIPLDTYTKP